MKRALGLVFLGLAACSPGAGRPDPGSDVKADLAAPAADLGGPADLGAPADLSPPEEVPALQLQVVAGQPGGPGYLNEPGSAARLDGPFGVAADGAGRLYVADRTSTIRTITLSTGTPALLAGRLDEYAELDGVGAQARLASVGSLALDRGTGDLWLTEAANYATVRRLVPATGRVSGLAGSPEEQRGAVDGTGSAALFNIPTGVVSDGAGTLYVSDTRNHTIRKVVVATAAVSTLAGDPALAGSADGVGTAALFSAPGQLALDGTGNLYVVDSGNHLIRRIALASATVSTLAGAAVMSGSADGTGSAARLYRPTGLVVSGGGLIVADTGNHTLRSVTLPTGTATAGTVTTLSGLAGSAGSADGTGSAARLSGPTALATDGAGSVYVADTGNHTVRRLDPATGAVTTVAGVAPQPGTADGLAGAARLSGPAGVVADAAGNAYVADRASYTIRKVVLATGAVTTLAGSAGMRGSTDGTGSAARFLDPYALALDGAGGLYVAEPYGQIVRRVDLATAAVTTLAGLAMAPGSSDGTGSAARFSAPSGIAADGAGNVYVADRSNSTIRKIVVATAAVTTLAGRPDNGPCRNGVGAAASFADPTGLALDGAGSLYVTEPLASLVRKVTLATGQVTTAAGLGSFMVDIAPGTTSPAIGIGAVYHPQSIAVDAAGNLYVATGYTLGNKISLILKIDLTARRITTQAGAPSQRGLRLSPLPAGINVPGGLALTPAGELLVTDTAENVLLRAR